MTLEFDRCPEATRHDADRSGRCRWCRKRVDVPVGRPESFGPGDGCDSTDLAVAYRRHYDPDYGSHKYD